MIFDTDRLVIRKFRLSDSKLFYEMMSNPNVMDPIPQKVFSKIESDEKLKHLLTLEESSSTKLWCLCEKGNDSLIGLGGFLENDENNPEIAYRLLEKKWGMGYGTEIANGLIAYGFEVRGFDKITADVFIENKNSAKIIAKFMKPVREFFNKKDDCIDRRYEISRVDYFEND